ncbi:MAG: peroxiredoxin [Gammaproteobacteria bacterium]|nr:MAG: peroxiredoxin [Gammaproteobacteria bacterium]
MNRLAPWAATAAFAALLCAASAAAGDAPAIGSVAPTFRLQDQNGAWHRPEDYRGRWLVLYFYPKDGTPGCTTQACEFRDNVFAFRDLGAAILGISVDDVAAHRKFAEENSLPFPILADSDRRTTAAWGTLTRYLGVLELARRDTFIIDPQGRIVKHYVKVNPEGHPATVLADLRQLAAATPPAASR